jgi:hypothetical protein
MAIHANCSRCHKRTLSPLNVMSALPPKADSAARLNSQKLALLKNNQRKSNLTVRVRNGPANRGHRTKRPTAESPCLLLDSAKSCQSRYSERGTADGVAVPWVTELGFGPGDQLGSPAGWAMKHHDATFRQMKFTESIPTKKAKTTAPSTELKR